MKDRDRAVPTSVRLPGEIRKSLERMAQRGPRRSISDLIVELLDEAIRTRRCPGIYFTNEPSGRTAKIAGTGLGVWEVFRDFRELGEDLKALRSVFPSLSEPQLTAGLLYARAYPKDIDREIEENAALTPDAVTARFPGLVRIG
jgi:uncharacterized protein (DUF433 family)